MTHWNFKTNKVKLCWKKWKTCYVHLIAFPKLTWWRPLSVSCSECAGPRCDRVPEQHPGGPGSAGSAALLLQHQRRPQQPQHHLDGDPAVQRQPAGAGWSRPSAPSQPLVDTFTHCFSATGWCLGSHITISASSSCKEPHLFHWSRNTGSPFYHG